MEKYITINDLAKINVLEEGQQIQALLDFTETLKSNNYVQPNGDRFLFKYNSSIYLFQLLSSLNLQKIDFNYLQNKKMRQAKSYYRTLKLVNSLDLINPHLVIGYTLYNQFILLISTQNYIYDYSRNLIMNQDDYQKLFQFQEINRLDKYEMDAIYNYLNSQKNFNLLTEFLLNPEKKLEIDQLQDKHQYNHDGFCLKNYLLYSIDGDGAFYMDEDFQNQKYGQERIALDYFTLNPTSTSSFINYLGNNQYELQASNSKLFRFELLSNYFEINELFTHQRFKRCHENSILLAYELINYFPNVFVIGGKQAKNDKEYYYHSWVEVEKENKTFVYDYNHNLIMEKALYQELYEAQEIARNHVSIYIDLTQNNHLCDFYLNNFLPNYFGEELNNDLKKVLSKIS